MTTKDEIFEYVMNTPGNTNPGVLRSLLDGVESGGAFVVTLNAANAADKSFAEIIAAYQAGKIPILVDSNNLVFQLQKITASEVAFITGFPDMPYFAFTIWSCSNANIWTDYTAAFES